MNVNTGEMGHIVGRTRSARSPRGLADLPVERRNLAENLVLLCPNCHNVIDKRLGEKVWSVTDLRAVKCRHEDRVHYLTGLGEDAETVVIRVMGNVRGATVSASPEEVRAAVHERQRYPRYELGVRSESDIEIDLRAFPDEDDPEYWRAVGRRIDDLIGTQLAAGVLRGHVRHVSVFGFARIPLLVMLGHHLDDKIPIDLYEHHRDDLGWRWATDEPPVAFRVEQIGGDPDADFVTLACSISGPAPRNRLPPETTAGAAVYELRPADAQPVTDLIRVPETLAAFSATYRAFLAKIEAEHAEAAGLNVVGAIPVTAAIEIGRRRTRDVHPPLRVWDRAQGGEYTLAVEVGS